MGEWDMNNQQVQNKPTAAYILSLLGGIIGLLASLLIIAAGAVAYMVVNSLGNVDVGNVLYDLSLNFAARAQLC